MCFGYRLLGAELRQYIVDFKCFCVLVGGIDLLNDFQIAEYFLAIKIGDE